MHNSVSNFVAFNYVTDRAWLALWLLLVTLFPCGSLQAADATVTAVGNQVIDSRALTLDQTVAQYGYMINGNSFQTPLTTANGYQFTAYFLQSGTAKHVAVARRQIPTPSNPVAAWSIVELPNSKFSNGLASSDAHNVVSLGVDPTDGTIHVAYDLHNNTLKYVRSIAGATTGATWNASVFNAQTSALIGTTNITSVTYPQFVRTPANGLQFYFRVGGSGNGSNWVYNYNNTSHNWSDGHAIDNGSSGSYTNRFGVTTTTRNDYPNGFTYSANGRLHHTFTYRESGGVYGNHDIMYVYSDDNGVTWKNNAGTMVSNSSTGLRYTVTSPGLVVRSMPAQTDMINQQGQNVDSQNQIHTVFSHLDTAKSPVGTSNYGGTNASYYVYWRDDLGNFHRNKIPSSVDSRPKILFNADDNAVVIFTRDNTLRIATATRAHNWTDWTVLDSVPNATGFSSEPLADEELMKTNGILSVYLQKNPTANNDPTDIHTLDYQVQFASKATNSWNVSTGNFGTTANWSLATVPGQQQDALITGNRTATINSTLTTAIGGDMALGSSAGAGALDVTSGSLAINGSLIVGQSGNGVGTLTQSAGTLNVAKRFVVGDFTNTTSGGGVSTATISGGILNCDELQIAMSANASSTNSALTISGTAAVNVAGEVIIADAGNTGTLNLAGGTLTIQGDLLTGWNKTNTSRLLFNGGTLNLTGNSLQVSQLTLNSGRLQNVLKLNNGQAITKDSAGVMAWAGINSLTNNFTIKNGSLRAESNNAWGTGQITIDGNAGNSGAAEFIGNITLNNPFILSGRQLASKDAPHLNNISGNNTISGTVTFTTGGNQYNFAAEAGQLAVTANLAGTGAVTGARTMKFMGAGNGVVSGTISNGTAVFTLVKMGTGSWTLSAANTYTGELNSLRGHSPLPMAR